MAHEARDEPLGERAQQLLRTLIESYIRDGLPVGSRALSRESGLQLSAATIRNVMADLEELGFVASPHTSAGRVPTDKGYRFFVDTLLHLRPLDEVATAEIRRQFEASRESSTELIATVSQLLSSATQLAGVVTLPRTRQASVTQMEFVGLSENRVLAHQHLHAPALEMGQQGADALRDTRIRKAADQRTGAHRKGHVEARPSKYPAPRC